MTIRLSALPVDSTWLRPIAWAIALSGATWTTAAAAQVPELPRGDVISAYYLGFAGGVAALGSAASRRAAAGPGAALGLSLGVALWNEIPVNLGFGGLFLKDRQPFEEFVVTCTTYGNADLGCSNPESQKSQVSATYLSVDTGYQFRIRPSKSVSLVPGALVGYLRASSFKRGVQCEGCTSIPVEGVSASGAYLTPTLRFVFGREQFFAISVRSSWFVSGDLQHMTQGGIELLAP